MAFDGFTSQQRDYLASQRVGRLATVDPSGVVCNAPVGYFFSPDDDSLVIAGIVMGRTKKFRNVEAGSRISFVVDDFVQGADGGWGPRCVEIRGTAEALRDVDPPEKGYDRALLVLHPESVLTLGVDPGKEALTLDQSG